MGGEAVRGEVTSRGEGVRRGGGLKTDARLRLPCNYAAAAEVFCEKSERGRGDPSGILPEAGVFSYGRTFSWARGVFRRLKSRKPLVLSGFCSFLRVSRKSGAMLGRL